MSLDELLNRCNAQEMPYVKHQCESILKAWKELEDDIVLAGNDRTVVIEWLQRAKDISKIPVEY